MEHQSDEQLLTLCTMHDIEHLNNQECPECQEYRVEAEKLKQQFDEIWSVI